MIELYSPLVVAALDASVIYSVRPIQQQQQQNTKRFIYIANICVVHTIQHNQRTLGAPRINNLPQFHLDFHREPRIFDANCADLSTPRIVIRYGQNIDFVEGWAPLH